jgi:large subunit ribosomal protein L22
LSKKWRTTDLENLFLPEKLASTEKPELVNNMMMNKIQKNLPLPVNLTVRSRYLSISPQKLRPIANLVRKKEINHSLNTLNFLPHKGARMLHKILNGALKQAKQKTNQKATIFYVSRIQIDRGTIRKKLMIRAKGNADTLRQVTSHLFLCLTSQVEQKTKNN